MPDWSKATLTTLLGPQEADDGAMVVAHESCLRKDVAAVIICIQTTTISSLVLNGRVLLLSPSGKDSRLLREWPSCQRQ